MATIAPDVLLDRQTDGPEGGPLWSDLDDEKAGPEMVRVARAIWTDQQSRRDQMLRQARVFANQWLGSLYDLATARTDRRAAAWNVANDAVSTAQSMVCRSPVNVTLETNGADHSAQRLAKDATRWLYGVWAENDVHTKLAPTLFNDAGIVDVGVAVARVVDKRIEIERAFPDEVVVSDVECIYGKPWQGFIRKFYPRHVVLDRWGDTDAKQAAIRAVTESCPANFGGYRSNLIPVWEGWSVKGKHIVAVEGATLWAEEWPHEFVPLVPMYIDRPLAGWYGRGYVQQLMGAQLELYHLNDAIEEHLKLFAASKWILEVGSGIDADDMDNEIGGILEKNKGAADPKLLVPEAVPTELIQERQSVYDAALQSIGLNSWSVKGQEPADRSGVAMEVARDKERGRLATAGANFEQWHVDLAYVCFALGSKTAGKAYDGRGPADKELGSVDFKTIATFLKEFPWAVKRFPISTLPEQPDAKRKEVMAMMESGLITGTVALSLLELPDVDAHASLESAARETIMWAIEEIVTKGRDGYHAPEPLMDLELGAKMFASAWNKYFRQGLDEERLDLLQRWVVEAIALRRSQAVKVPAAATEIRPGVGAQPAAVPLPGRVPELNAVPTATADLPVSLPGNSSEAPPAPALPPAVALEG